MPILDTDITWRAASLTSDTTPAQNGGRMGTATLTSGVKNNIFADASSAERTAGSVRHRKAFVHIASAADVALQAVRIYLDTLTPGADWVTISPGTQTDTQDNAAGRPYGIATLQANAASAATTLTLVGENPAAYATLTPFRIGDTIRIATNTGTASAPVWTAEAFHALSDVTYAAGTITATITPALASAYTSATAIVSSIYTPPDIQASATAPTVTSAAGTLTAVTAHNKGSIEQTWTLTFADAHTYTASGDTLGPLAATGSTTADYAPTNPATASAYFKIPSTNWGGTYAAADTVTFTTHPAAVPLWYRREIPANAASLAGDFTAVSITGESA